MAFDREHCRYTAVVFRSHRWMFDVKLLTNRHVWQQWVQDEIGRFADALPEPPTAYPCFGHMELESWGQETLRPCYLYEDDINNMAVLLLAIKSGQ